MKSIPSLVPSGSSTDGLTRSRVVAASPVYYGWVILIAGMLGTALTLPGQTIGVSAFLDNIIADLGISRATVSLMYTVGTLGGSFLLPFIGRFLDRRGPRLAATIIATVFALACVLMGSVQNIIMLAVGFVLIRGFGQGALSLASFHIINLWFVRKRGFAVGVAGLGFALTSAIFPRFVLEPLITNFGWRSAYMLLGLGIAVIMIPVAALLFRTHPEAYGLVPDGHLQASSSQPKTFERHYTLREARKTSVFWLFLAAGFTVACLGTGLIFHHYDIAASSGLSRLDAAIIFGYLGLVSGFANFSTGMLLDRIPPRFVLALPLLLLGANLLLAPRVNSSTLIAVYGMSFGISQGMFGAINGSVFAHYFGRRHIGEIKGFVTTVMVAGTALGPLIFALGRDAFGSYGPILAISATVPFALAFTAPWLRPPSNESLPADAEPAHA
ncbi:MAG: MFS transporter [Deinococcota bacterium]